MKRFATLQAGGIVKRLHEAVVSAAPNRTGRQERLYVARDIEVQPRSENAAASMRLHVSTSCCTVLIMLLVTGSLACSARLIESGSLLQKQRCQDGKGHVRDP